ncbi:nitrite reductase small subunit NirD [Auraticoccus monumenti]|uniref:Assimilatory nitrite reductase (NAD(P)H) small subunit n=1 Tax=Auraticoccus monumenti TaxID=675864 RepID=A0A1G7DIH0_9ACTN|nr:nitrite reductase small subunit NirD [Auraticoccus monumenti]SDE51289.1 assimilatory nitrite reductase (NAD(P)H) small subunit [Auraticoccus monumenti]
MSLDTAPLTTPGTTGETVVVCSLAELVPERGVAALVDGRQVALFRMVDDTVLAVQQHDPYSGANVMSRGLVGTRGDRWTVASPMYKQVFDLATGECLETQGKTPTRLLTWSVVCEDGLVRVGLQPRGR